MIDENLRTIHVGDYVEGHEVDTNTLHRGLSPDRLATTNY